MDEMMNSPAAAAMMQALQSDPELMQMLQSRPDLTEKLMQIRANPGMMMQYMQDPDFAQLVQRLQAAATGAGMDGSMMGGGGGGGGFGGGGGRGGARAGAAPAGGAVGVAPKPGADHIINLRSHGEWAAVLKAAGDKVVIVDAGANWCTWCHKIAPTFASLAFTYKDRAVFIKFDTDKLPALKEQLGINGLPNFQFWRNNRKIDEINGANENALRDLTEKYATPLNVEPPCPYRHFPLKPNEQAFFTAIKWEPVTKRMKEVFAELKGTGVDASLLPNEAEVKSFDGLITQLTDTSSWHSKDLSIAHYNLIDKALKWGTDQVGPILHVVRMALTHPGAVATWSKRTAASGADILTQLIKVTRAAKKPIAIMNAVRTIANLFNRRAMAKSIAARSSDVFDLLAEVIKTPDEEVKKACIAVFINYSIMFREDPKLFADAKTHALTNMQDVLESVESKSHTYSALIIIGTLCYRDDACTKFARDLEIHSAIATLKSKQTAPATTATATAAAAAPAAASTDRDQKNLSDAITELIHLFSGSTAPPATATAPVATKESKVAPPPTAAAVPKPATATATAATAAPANGAAAAAATPSQQQQQAAAVAQMQQMMFLQMMQKAAASASAATPNAGAAGGKMTPEQEKAFMDALKAQLAGGAAPATATATATAPAAAATTPTAGSATAPAAAANKPADPK